MSPKVPDNLKGLVQSGLPNIYRNSSAEFDPCGRSHYSVKKYSENPESLASNYDLYSMTDDEYNAYSSYRSCQVEFDVGPDWISTVLRTGSGQVSFFNNSVASVFLKDFLKPSTDIDRLDFNDYDSKAIIDRIFSEAVQLQRGYGTEPIRTSPKRIPNSISVP